jgi:hypothetical protein
MRLKSGEKWLRTMSTSRLRYYRGYNVQVLLLILVCSLVTYSSSYLN